MLRFPLSFFVIERLNVIKGAGFRCISSEFSKLSIIPDAVQFLLEAYAYLFGLMSGFKQDAATIRL